MFRVLVFYIINRIQEMPQQTLYYIVEKIKILKKLF